MISKHLNVHPAIVRHASVHLGADPDVVIAFEEALGSFSAEEAANMRALPVPVVRELGYQVASFGTLRDRL